MPVIDEDSMNSAKTNFEHSLSVVSPQGRNICFNEAMGTELYRAVGLPVPDWKPLIVTEEFLEENPQCWFETPEGSLKPESGTVLRLPISGRGWSSSGF
jgi:hypothetical protein